MKKNKDGFQQNHALRYSHKKTMRKNSTQEKVFFGGGGLRRNGSTDSGDT